MYRIVDPLPRCIMYVNQTLSFVRVPSPNLGKKLHHIVYIAVMSQTFLVHLHLYARPSSVAFGGGGGGNAPARMHAS